MNVKKFIAPTSREALKKVRLMLGENAVILSNRSIDGQVEILAMNDQALTEIAPESEVQQKSLVMQRNETNSSSWNLGFFVLFLLSFPFRVVLPDRAFSTRSPCRCLLSEVGLAALDQMAKPTGSAWDVPCVCADDV